MSNSKIITYDLCNSGKNYDELYDYLKSYNVWARITESTWFISTDKSCITIGNELQQIVDSDDKFFVAELTGIAAWHNVICNSDYLKKHL